MSTALERIREAKEKQKQQTGQEQSSSMVIPETLDWKKVPPNVLAPLLAAIPVSEKDGIATFLKPAQAIIWAMVCYEMDLSPFTGDTWFNTRINRVNLTLQGKLKRARALGFNFGAPQFEDVSRPWTVKKLLPIDTEPGCKCTITVNGTETSSYVAWYSEWFMPGNPNWVNRTTHMMRTRAHEKLISQCSGVGVSEEPGERDIEAEAAVTTAPLEATVPVEVKE